MKRFSLFLLLIILIGGFLTRVCLFNALEIYKIRIWNITSCDFQRPVADWHSWRQADTSSVSRYFVKHGYDILTPHFDDLSQGVSLLDNPQGYRFVEFPFYNIAQAGLYQLFGYLTIEEWGRLVTIFSSLITTVFLFLIVGKYVSLRAGLISAAFMAFVPYNIYYGRIILPDQTTVAALLAALYFFDRWIDKQKLLTYTLALLFMIMALLLKPYVLFFGLPFAYLAIRRFGKRVLYNPFIIVFVIVSLAPLAAWRLWMQNYPEGIPQSNWLFNGTNIRFKGAFFHWLFAKRISELVLGYFGVAFVIVGILARTKKEGLLFHSFFVSSLAYMIVMATGNVQHDYYQILIIPTLAMYFGKGIELLISKASQIFNLYVSYIAIAVCVVFMEAFGWFLVRDYYLLQHLEVVDAGKAVDKLVPKDAKVIAPYGGDTTFLYYTNRQGWPVVDRPFKDFIKQGATTLAFVNPGADELNFRHYFETLDKQPNYVIFDLTKPLKPLDSK